MRRWISLFEKQVQWPADLLEIIEQYQLYVSYSDVHDARRHPWQQRLIAFMQPNPHHVDGMLYRATVTDDDTAEALLNNQSATHRKAGSLLESWSKTICGAAQYASGLEDQSAIIMAFPAAHLKIVCDLDQVPLPENHEPGEVLVMAEDRAITRRDILALIWCDYDNTGEHRLVAPKFDRELDYHEFEQFLRDFHA